MSKLFNQRDRKMTSKCIADKVRYINDILLDGLYEMDIKHGVSVSFCIGPIQPEVDERGIYGEYTRVTTHKLPYCHIYKRTRDMTNVGDFIKEALPFINRHAAMMDELDSTLVGRDHVTTHSEHLGSLN